MRNVLAVLWISIVMCFGCSDPPVAEENLPAVALGMPLRKALELLESHHIAASESSPAVDVPDAIEFEHYAVLAPKRDEEIVIFASRMDGENEMFIREIELKKTGPKLPALRHGVVYFDELKLNEIKAFHDRGTHPNSGVKN